MSPQWDRKMEKGRVVRRGPFFVFVPLSVEAQARLRADLPTVGLLVSVRSAVVAGLTPVYGIKIPPHDNVPLSTGDIFYACLLCRQQQLSLNAHIRSLGARTADSVRF